jgi:hypothetical protein
MGANFSGGHDLFYPDGDSINLSVLSAGGATVSTAVLGTQTRAIQLVAVGSVTSTSGVRVKMVSPADSAVSSTVSALLPVNWVQTYKVVPGQRVSAIGNDGATYTLVVTPLTD